MTPYASYFQRLPLERCIGYDGECSVFRIMPEDVKLFPELEEFHYIKLYEQDDGSIWETIT